jgi:hypothetical protein
MLETVTWPPFFLDQDSKGDTVLRVVSVAMNFLGHQEGATGPAVSVQSCTVQGCPVLLCSFLISFSVPGQRLWLDGLDQLSLD